MKVRSCVFNNSCFLRILLFIMISINSFQALCITAEGDSIVRRSIYPSSMKQKGNFYNKIWGEHYRNLYTVPIAVPSTTLDRFNGGVEVMDQAEDFHGLLLKGKDDKLYLLKPLGGSTSFIESDFFQEMYNKADFEDTYLDQFIGDAYTIINPYTFIAADHLAQAANLPSTNSRIYYLPAHSTNDTIATGGKIEDRLVSIRDMLDVKARKNVIFTQQLLDSLKLSDRYQIDRDIYIRERLFDMLIGDWNKIPENWNWQARQEGDSIIFSPIVIDRNHAFTKVDGFLFKQMLSVLALGFITDYEGEFKHIKKLNSLGFALDMSLTHGSDDNVWLEQAKYLQNSITDAVIDDAFNHLPTGIESAETDTIKINLKRRRELLADVANQYYNILQRTPVIIGRNADDRFEVERSEPDSLHIRIYDMETDRLYFDRSYNRKQTKEIWLYGLEGNDSLHVQGEASKRTPVYFISGGGDNAYSFDSDKGIKIYAYPEEKAKLKGSGAKVIYSDLESVHQYDYEKINHRDISFTPWGVYDSDNGISLGVFMTYTKYGFKRSPFTYRHRIGYNYLEGFMYQGVFPFYDSRKSINLEAFISSPGNFFNFFGFGNQTNGYKDEKDNYNRVKITQYTIAPSFHFSFSNDEKIAFFSSFESIKAARRDDRLIGQYYPEDHRIFDANYFMNLGVNLQTNKQFSGRISKLEAELLAGWKMNLEDASRNFPYAEAKASMDFRIVDRFTFATQVHGKALFSNDYEFYQSATTELRGFRDNRFIGKQSFYQYSDLRLDMGSLKNPFTPVKYGVFAGIDYGRVWYPGENSKHWHTSYGGGLWLTIINKITTKYSMFGSSDSFRFMFELGMGF